MLLFLMICLSAVVLLFLLYLLAIMPGMRHKPGIDLLRGVLYAHRGLHNNESSIHRDDLHDGDAHSDRSHDAWEYDGISCDGEAHGDKSYDIRVQDDISPENSMAAFRKAVDAGYGIELDLQMSKDGRVVIFHDDTLERVCGVEGYVSEYTYDELQEFRLFGTPETIPLFEDFLAMVDGRVPLIVEIKISGKDLSVCPAADALLRQYRGIYCVESFHPFALLWFKKHHSEVVRGQLADKFTRSVEHSGITYRLLENLLFNFLTRPDFIAFNHHYAHMLSRRICRRFYKNMAVAWTIKSEEELEAARKEFDLFIFESFM